MNKSNLIFILIALFAILGCSNQENQALKQETNALLADEYKAICYSGFRSGQHPDRGNGAVNPSYEEILVDLQILTRDGFNLLRLYDSGVNSEMVLHIIQKHKLDMKVMLGIWLQAELSNHETCTWLTEPIPDTVLATNTLENHAEIERGIQLAQQYPDIVAAVNVGNEALVEWNDHKVDVDTLIGYVRHVKSHIEQPVTVAENYKWWADHGTQLAQETDFISVHIYPIWEGKTIKQALDYSIENLLEVREALPESKMVISEAGWPTTASEFPEQANEENQATYYRQILKLAKTNNITTFIFEAFDEDWKGDPENMAGAEKHWGIYTIYRQPKQVMQESNKQ